MNQDGSHQEITAKDESHIAQIERRDESTEPDPVDEYMRHVGKTLYKIIRDWVREQKTETDELRDLESEETKLAKGDTK